MNYNVDNIYIEGNIGSGKTTFLDFLKSQENNPFNIIYEPVDEWTSIKDDSGKNLLEHFYEDQNKWSFAFQINSFISRVNRIDTVTKEHNSNINIIERSVYTDKECFAKNCFETGKMTAIEYNIYCRWHQLLCDNFSIKPRAFIYLRTDPNVSHERIIKRNRGGEDGIPIEYLTLLHNLHDNWLINEKENGIPVLIIDITENIYETEESKKEIILRINNFIESL